MTLNFSENLDEIGEQLAEIMSHSPFLALTNTRFTFDKTEQKFTAKTMMSKELVGNASYQILHGGVSATVDLRIDYLAVGRFMWRLARLCVWDARAVRCE